MNKISLYFAALSLTSCATSAEKIISDKPPMKVYNSSKNHQEIVQCMYNTVGLPAEPRNGDWSISLRNQFGIIINWYIKPSDNGSTIELRRTQSIAPGIAAAEKCF